MAQDRKEHGHVLLVAVIAVVIAVVGIGVWQYVRSSNSKDADRTTQQVATEEGQENAAAETEVDPSGEEFLVIKEWGVQVTLPESLGGDVSYFVNERIARDFGVERVDFVSKKFSAGSLKCAVVEGDTPRSVTAIMREVGTENGETLDPQPFKRIGDTRYYLVTTGCAEAIAREGSPQDKQLLDSLETAISTTLQER